MGFLRKLLRLRDSVEPAPAPVPVLEPPAAERRNRLCVGWATDIGQVRRHNQDAVLSIEVAHNDDGEMPPLGLFILADGMGGHQAGEVASSLAARTVAAHIVRQVMLPTLLGEEHGAEQPSLSEALMRAVNIANLVVAEKVPGGGTTLTCALVIGSQICIAHVGDSRAYLISPAEMQQITRDHSLVDRLIELGQLSRKEAASHPHKNVLYQAVGQGGLLDVDTYVRTFPPQGRLLLCSDGLWSLISDAEIAAIVAAAPSPQAACNALVEAANRAGGRDNITAILVEPPPPM